MVYSVFTRAQPTPSTGTLPLIPLLTCLPARPPPPSAAGHARLCACGVLARRRRRAVSGPLTDSLTKGTAAPRLRAAGRSAGRRGPTGGHGAASAASTRRRRRRRRGKQITLLACCACSSALLRPWLAGCAAPYAAVHRAVSEGGPTPAGGCALAPLPPAFDRVACMPLANPVPRHAPPLPVLIAQPSFPAVGGCAHPPATPPLVPSGLQPTHAARGGGSTLGFSRISAPPPPHPPPPPPPSCPEILRRPARPRPLIAPPFFAPVLVFYVGALSPCHPFTWVVYAASSPPPIPRLHPLPHCTCSSLVPLSLSGPPPHPPLTPVLGPLCSTLLLPLSALQTHALLLLLLHNACSADRR